ncbi:hypothetical protein M0813_20257 [Anaeramoeba flamelloides]|uniref:Uncharacterized protein n=1 Tax=Anaeramoeba flamelloides TaxID=1746091 RepID=A0ABQ8YLF9_9EUKA|nr:hypothetical protein M0813_20257 [Anaeramoeba flamelloides]
MTLIIHNPISSSLANLRKFCKKKLQYRHQSFQHGTKISEEETLPKMIQFKIKPIEQDKGTNTFHMSYSQQQNRLHKDSKSRYDSEPTIPHIMEHL